MTTPFTSALGRGDLLASCPGCFTPWERNCFACEDGWVSRPV